MRDRSLDSTSELLDSASAKTEPLLAGRLDPVSDVLDTVRLRGAVFFLWEPGLPYGIGVAEGQRLCRHIQPRSDCIISYHVVIDGPCWAAVNDEPPIRLQTGDTLVLPRGDAYKIASSPQYPTPEDEQASIAFFKAMSEGKMPAVVTDGGPGPQRNKLICGFLGCAMGPYNPLLLTLPRMMRVPAPESSSDPLASLISFALTESRQSCGGERSLLSRLSEVMFVEVLRRYLRSGPTDDAGWLAGLRDPLVGRSLAILHQNVARPWTVQALARATGVSRSTLSKHFTKTVGVAPMQYLTQWRMQVAAHRLSEGGAKLIAVALDVGYDSEAAFSRAFKRVTGLSPRQWRKRY